MNNQAPRVTQQDIAKAAGVHRTTVCLALKNHPNIPESTRAKIRTLADKLGYVPDPMLSALAVYRDRKHPRAFQGSLAWLANNEPPFDWREKGIFKKNHGGAVASAKSHGYTLEVFDLQTPGMTAKRMAGILRARNISGILVAPQPRPNTTLDFPWENFSAIAFGFTLAKPALHCVTSSVYQATLQTIRHIRAQGYRRIGFASTSMQDERFNHSSLSVYLAEMFLHGEEPLVLPMRPEGCTPQELRGWVKQVRPEALLVSLDVADMIGNAGLEIPRDVALACPSLAHDKGPLAGICENAFLVGEVAVDQLVAMLQRDERGVPSVLQRVFVEGYWVSGSTLPMRRPQRSRRSR